MTLRRESSLQQAWKCCEQADATLGCFYAEYLGIKQTGHHTTAATGVLATYYPSMQDVHKDVLLLQKT